MNSHQSLAEALETCKYIENFTSHGARSCSHGNPPRSPPDPTATRHPRPRTVASPDTCFCFFCFFFSGKTRLPRHIPKPRVKEHNTATSEVTYSCVYQQFFTTCNRETESSTVHKSCRSNRRRPRG